MEYTVKDRVIPARLSGVRLGGASKVISDRFFEERIFCDYAKEAIFKEAEDAFVNQIDDEQYVCFWQGEFWGKWIISAADVYRYTEDQDLLRFLREACYRLIGMAREDGYINTYRDSLHVFAVDPIIAKEKCNMRVNWNWNIWCRKYTLWGLLSVYEITRDEKILLGAKRLADQLIDELAANGIELRKTGTFVGLPSCSILKPMLLLYRYTDDRKYFDFSLHEIADNWERDDNACPNLISNAISGKRLTDWYPDSPSWAKAYEMMSCYEGLCELYRYTNDPKHLKACEGVYEILKKYELNPAFSVAYNDVFADAADEINLISEPCDAIHWMRLCYELFCITGNVKYMDSIELTYENAFLAGVFKDGKWGARGIRGAGSPMWSETQAGMKLHHCCVNNMPRAFARIAEAAVMRTEDAILVNLYEEFNATLSYDGGCATVEIGDGYLDAGRVTVTTRFEGKKLPICFRIPAWCRSAEVTVDGVTTVAKNGYFEVIPASDACEVTIDFHVTVEIHTFDKPVPQYTELVNDKPHWKLARWINRKQPGETTEDLFLRVPKCTLTYGPILLARSKSVGSTEAEMFTVASIDATYSCKLLDARRGDDHIRVMLDLELSNGTDTLRTTVCDFASAGNEKLTDVRYFSMYF